MRVIRVILLFTFYFFCLRNALIAQVEKKVSFDFFSGIVGFPHNEKNNAIGQASNIFANYNPGIQFGAGWNYKFSNKIYFSNGLTHFGSWKSNYRLNGNSIKLGLKYFPINSTHKISPYLTAGFHINFLTIRRSRYDQDFYPDSTANAIGSGIGVTHIAYHYEYLKLEAMPTKGFSVGAGASVMLSPKVSLFLDYSLNVDNTKKVALINDHYPSNNSNLNYQFLTGGITIKFLKPTKQLIATLTKDQWDGDPSIKVRGTIVYKKKSKIFEKQVDVEMVNSKDSLVSKIPANQEAKFTTKNIFPDEFKFMLEKPNRKIIRADLEIIHNNRLSIFDDYPPLTIVDDAETDNLISRDNNFSVVLREGFQHEVGITALSNNVSGKLSASGIKQACKNILVFLKNKRDSIVGVTKPNEDCTFGFSDIPSGPYTLIFVTQNPDSLTNFNYYFNEPSPIIQRQFNGEKDSSLVVYNGQLSEWKEDTMNVDRLLLYQNKRVEVKRAEELISKEEAKPKETKNIHRVIIHPNGVTEIKNATDSTSVIPKDSELPTGKEKEQYKIEEKVGKNPETSGKQLSMDEKKNRVSENRTIPKKANNYSNHSLPSGKTYNLNGDVVNVSGYAVQVGAFASYENARKLGTKVNAVTHGSAALIQVLPAGDKKLYRVVVGEYKDLKTASLWQEKLKKSGYDTYVRKHMNTGK